uniref:Uncharacterized protein n=2 Tax=Opuntia streptacantha TaxID=393608 RepID=A0A7C8Z419_OPUST
MLRMMGNNNKNHEDLVAYSAEFESLQQLWKNELDWNQVLIRRYIGREALWLHRRFLSVHWVKRFGAGQNAVWTSPNEKANSTNHISVFIDNELNLLQDCLRISYSEFEDVQSQAIHSASYILWLSSMCTRQCISITPSPPPETSWPSDIGLNEKLRGDALRTLLIKLSPERTKLWQFLLSNLLLSETEG